MKSKQLLTIIAAFLLLGRTQAQNGTSLYVSKQTGEFTVFSGQAGKQTDKYETGTTTVTTTGPVNVTVNPNDLSIGPNQAKMWQGMVSPNLATAPVPGSFANGSINANYDVTYSRPVGLGSGGTVTSTYQCAESMASAEKGCAYHNGNPGSHEIVQKQGTETMNFTVYSILLSLSDTICVQRVANANQAIGTETAIVYPAHPGVVVTWRSMSPNVTLQNVNGATATIVLNDTNTLGLVEAKMNLNGVTYTVQAVVKSCECGCRPVFNGMAFGPLTLAFNINPKSGQPTNGFCEYEVANATLNQLNLVSFVNKNVANLPNVNLKFKKNCKTGEVKDVTLTWAGNMDIGKIRYIDAAMKSFALAVDIQTGNLTGQIGLQAKLDNDVDLLGAKGIMMLRKGVTGNFKFNFSGGNNFNGSFDFDGVRDINIDIVKENKNIAQFKNGSLTAAGLLNGTINGLVGVKYKSNLFTVEVVALALDFTVDLPNFGFRTNAGNGSIKVYDIRAVQGQATLGLAFNQQNVNANLTANNFSAFTMAFQQVTLSARFNYDFDMVEFDGTIQAKHNSFDLAIGISKFHVENGVLTKFEGNAAVKYNGFGFDLQSIAYTASLSELNITAKCEINVTVQASLAVSNFKIAENGAITVGAIAGSFVKAPVNVAFNATFAATRFTGTFTAQFSSAAGLSGIVDIGSEPDYNFGYLSLTAGVNLPLGQSGLKLSQIGGKFGFNYALPAGNTGGLGTPTQGNYVFGGRLGVADMANMVEVVGDVTVQLGNGNFQLDIAGSITVLKNNPFFTGNVTVTYKLPANTVEGNVGVSLKVPSSGWVFSTNNVNVGFFFGSGSWNVNGRNMSGAVFNNFIQLTNGTIAFSGSNGTQTTGTLGGQARIGFNKNIGTTVLGIDFNAGVFFNMNAGANISFNQNGMTGGFNAHMSAGGSMGWDCWITTGSVGISATCDGAVSYDGSSVNVNGNLDIPLPFTICIPFGSCFSSVGFGVNVSF